MYDSVLWDGPNEHSKGRVGGGVLATLIQLCVTVKPVDLQ